MSLSVLHVLPGLGFGGTEFVVARLVRAERALGVQNQILYLKGDGPLAEELQKDGVPCHRLTKGAGLSALARWIFPTKKGTTQVRTFLPLPLAAPRRARDTWGASGADAGEGRGEGGGEAFRRPEQLPKGTAPSFDLIHGWLYSGNLMAGVLARGRPGTRLIWNLMQANLSPAVNSPKTRLLMRVGAHFSIRWPDRVVCNSLAAQRAHEGIGFDSTKMVLIPNGVDTGRFQPNVPQRAQFRKEWNLSSEPIVLGHLARWDPQKDHRMLVEAFRLLVSQGVNAHLFMAGPGVTIENPLLMKWIQETGVSDRFHLLGSIEDAPRFLAGLDIFCLSSLGESSSYALAEAMACGVPSVVTDVGDARDVVGDTGVVVPPAQPQAFCEGLLRLTSLSSSARSHQGAQARDRIVQNYSFNKMVNAYQTLYKSILRAIILDVLLHNLISYVS